MDDTRSVSGSQSGRNLNGHIQCLGRRQPSLFHEVSQRQTINMLHRDEATSVWACANLENHADIGMIET